MLKKSGLAWPMVCAVVVSMTACSSNSAGTGDTSANGGSEECISAVTAAVEKARAPLDLVVPESSINLEALAGKKIWVINVLTNQFISDANEGYEAAAAAAGVDLTIFDGQGSADKWNEGMQQAIAQGADAIALFGVDTSIIAESVKEAHAAGIPVVESLATDYDSKRSPDVYSNISADYNADGAALANWTLADSQCTANTYLLYSTGLPIWVDMQQGVHDVYEEYCPECVITESNVDLANVATELPRLTQTKMTQSSDTKYLLTTWDSAVPFVESAAAQIRPDAVILGRDGIEAALEEIRNDGMQKVTVAAPPAQWIAWVVVDDMLRAMAGEKPNGIVVPTRLIDSTNVGETDADILPDYANFESEFQKVWGK